MNLFKSKNNKGFVILFALMVSSVILAISIGVSSIALKEVSFSTSAKGTNDAFFSADTAAECALYHDRTDINAFPISGTVGAVNCSTNESGSGDGVTALYSFTMTGLGGQAQSCAKVTISKNAGVDPMITTITAKGYNIGDASCSSTNANRVERELEITY